MAEVIAQDAPLPHLDVKLFNRWSFDDVQVSVSFFALHRSVFSIEH
jgi:hypothetical protein